MTLLCALMTDTVVGGPALSQQRRLVTSIPGPKSAALMKRKEAVVADTIAPLLPEHVAERVLPHGVGGLIVNMPFSGHVPGTVQAIGQALAPLVHP
jgi:hypothetical protein